MSLADIVPYAPIVGGICVILAALIAAFSALYGHKIAQRNAERLIRVQAQAKLSEMRLAWINDLRDSMATFHSYAMTPALQHASEREFYEHGTRIELFMNPKDIDFSQLQKSMYRALAATTHSEKWAGNSEFIDICQRILKREWNRLRDDLNKAGLS